MTMPILKSFKYFISIRSRNEINNNTDVEFTPNKGDCLSVFGLAGI